MEQINAIHDQEQTHSSQRTWRPLRLLNLLRGLTALILVIYLQTPAGNNTLQLQHVTLFNNTAFGLLICTVIAFIAIELRRPNFALQVYLLAAIDIVAYTVLMHAAGSVSSGLGMLLLISIAGTALLLPERGASSVAAAATLSVLIEQTYVYITNPFAVNYTHAGMLGAGFFITALLTHILGKRLRESEQLALQRGIDLANMAQLNDHVIQMLQAGIVVVDGNNQIRLINQAAWQMLGRPLSANREPLQQVSPALADALRRWKENPAAPTPEIHATQKPTGLQARFIRLGRDNHSGQLIYLEDSSALTQQAQQLKLASLGQLTASIAHEIRNPLGAISHASQLLGESPALDKADLRLVEIIRNHSQRMNTIIENILQLSRREQFKPQECNLHDWATDFACEFCEMHGLARDEIAVDITPADTLVTIDAAQMQQVLWNLCQNGLRYSQDYPGTPKLELRGGLIPDQPEPILDIIDHGTGIAPEVAQHIFEPFYTTGNGGTGLGLYIARELCECNRARLEHLANPNEEGSCFRITFSQHTDNKTLP